MDIQQAEEDSSGDKEYGGGDKKAYGGTCLGGYAFSHLRPWSARLCSILSNVEILLTVQALILADKWWTVDLYLAGMSELRNVKVYMLNRSARYQPGIKNMADRRIFQ